MVSTNAIVAMKGIAADPKKRSALMQDSACLGGLVMVLSNKDPKIVKLSLETLSLLAESIENRSPLRDFIGLVDQLDSLIIKSKDEEIQRLTEKLYTTITTVEMVTPLKDTKNTSRQNISTCSNKSYVGRRAKTIVLQIRGMLDKHDREVCMKLLLQVKGIISVTFDLNKKRCIARTRADIKPETLVQSVARSQTMSAQQVIKDDKGVEVLISFGSNHDDMDKENGDLPGYLSDDGHSPVVDSKAMARTGHSNKKSGWLGAAASFLSNSFYW